MISRAVELTVSPLLWPTDWKSCVYWHKLFHAMLLSARLWALKVHCWLH